MSAVQSSGTSVSVVVPCYRCADTIERAVASVAAQTLVPAEVVLVDDCSPDDTLDVLRDLQSRYPSGWIRIIALDRNGGPSVARNKGWDAATGKYIAFLDADDSWDPAKTEVQLAWMESHPDVSLSGTRNRIGLRRAAAGAERPVRAIEILPRQLLLSNRFCTSGVMLLRQIRFRFDESKNRSEDYQLWATLLLSGHRSVLLDRELAIYHKPFFGGSGLSADLWKMQAGQVDTYLKLVKGGLISRPRAAVLLTWSCMRFGWRLTRFGANAVSGRNAPR